MAVVDAPGGEIPVLTLNRSDKRNALNDAVIAEFLTAADGASTHTRTGVTHDGGAS